MQIVIENLSFTYGKKSPYEKKALDSVSLTVNEGECVGIVGATGSGKSTLIQHLNGLIKLTDGKITVGEIDLSKKKPDYNKLRKSIGMLFQYPEYQLFAETVFDDVAFGLKNFYPDMEEGEKVEAVREALETVGLDYEEIKNRSPFELSGGQKRRVAIAGVIVTKPEILVLDEPAAGLDPLGKEEIMSLLHDIHARWCKTVIIVSHDMDEIAENCTRAAIFAEGKVLAVAPPKALFADVQKLHERGLDVPFTAKITNALKAQGIVIENDYSVADFIEKTVAYANMHRAGTQSTAKGGLGND